MVDLIMQIQLFETVRKLNKILFLLFNFLVIYTFPLECIVHGQDSDYVVSLSGTDDSNSSFKRIIEPPEGKLYHGVTPGSQIRDTGEQVKEEDVISYQRQAGKNVAWVYFSNEWLESEHFPKETVKWISYLGERGAVPYIRLMLRSSYEQSKAERERCYTLQRIIDGQLDDPLRKWAQAAVNYGKPLIVEYGTECNGAWFPWNGQHNGGANKKGFGDPGLEDGPERFVHAYRHIIKLMRDEVGAKNITWVFHVNSSKKPNEVWNNIENYYLDNREKYPHDGPDYIDWLAVSCYGAQKPNLDYEPEIFSKAMKRVYDELQMIAPEKPVIVAEFGTTSGYFEYNLKNDKPVSNKFKPDNWANAALEALFKKEWNHVIGFSWWNEYWTNDTNPEHDTNMRLECIYELSQSFRNALERHSNAVQEIPIIK